MKMVETGDDVDQTGIVKNKWSQLIVLITTIVMADVTLANPVLDHVAAGQVTVSQVPNSTVVNQGSQKAIINWQSFNIGAAEKTHFQQPAGGIALNRISPTQGASQIYGQLTATGKIILVNQAGIFFGPGSRVDVGGIIASTSDISDANFLAGKYHFDRPSQYNGSVINEGSIRAAEHGLVALVGTGVRNDGTIQAHMGNVVLASGNKFTVDLYGDQLVNFTVDEAANSAGVDHHGNKLTDGVRNNGAVLADGGTIIMSARAARGVVDNVVNMKGVAQARSVSQKNGVIILDGGDGRVSVSGKVDVSGKSKYARGGKVKILARNVHVEKTAVIDASGDAGGGEILIGGNYQGKGPEQNAYSTRVDKGAEINADAITQGDGGRVIAWADNDTGFYGNISARGGIEGGNGGFVETSGKNFLDVEGAFIDTRAPLGLTGTWLLDPTNIYIALDQTNATAAGMSGTDTSANTVSSGTFAASGAVNDSLLTTGSLITALGSSNIIVTTTNASGGGAGNITVVDPVSWSSANTLTLTAANNIVINAAITASNGGLTLSAVNTANSITTGSAGAINVKNFILSQGEWTQTSASNPAFSVSNNFQIATGLVYNNIWNAKFIRNSGTTSIGGFAYDLITDIYGLQGVGTQSLAGRYALANHIDASVTLNWLGNPTRVGARFVPISTVGLNALTGSIDGQGYVINNLYMTSGFVGVNSGTVSNVGLTNITLTGGDFNGGIAQFNTSTIRKVYVTGNLTVSKFSGGLVGENSGLIENSYSAANVIASNTSAGGLVGSVTSGSIVRNSYSTGRVTGSSNVGGLIGGAAVGGTTVTNSFWDTQTSGRATSVAGGTGKTTSEMMQQTTFCPSGTCSGDTSHFDFATNWGIIEGTSYPYLLLFNPTTPRVVSGFVPGGSSGATGLGGSTVNVAVNGAVLTGGGGVSPSTSSGNNGFYYFLEPTGAIADSSALITYLTGSSANAVTLAPASGSSITGLTMTANTVTVGDSRTQTLTNTNALLGSAKGGLSSNILYTTSGSNLTLNSGISLAPTATTTYDLDGNITASGSGSVTFAGNVLLAAASPVISVVNGNIAFNGNITGSGKDLTLTGGSGSNSFTLTNALTLDDVTINGGTGTNTLNLQTSSASQAFAINASNAGSVVLSGVTGTFGFSNIQNLVGGSNTDSFTFANGQAITGSLNGGAGSNSLDWSAYTSAVDVNLQASTATGIGTTFTGINSFTGNGSNGTLTGANGTHTFNITADNGGNIDSSTTFLAFGNLVGGTGNDSFVFSDGRSIDNLNGGAGTNTLDYTLYTSPVVVSLASFSATGINGSFGSIGNFVGNSANSDDNILVGPLSGPYGWFITDNNAGNIDSTPYTFTDFGTLSASDMDFFFLSDGKGIYSLNTPTGGTLSYAAYTSDVAVDFTNGTGTNVGSFSGITSFVGGAGNNTFTETTGDALWQINNNNSGTILNLPVYQPAFVSFNNLVGGNDDVFVPFEGKTIDSISATNGTLDFTDYTTSNVSVDIGLGSATNVGSFSGITNFTGGSVSGNSLTYQAGGNTWDITDNNAGTVNGFSFSAFDTVAGGANDRFVLADGKGLASVSATSGGILDYSLYSGNVDVTLDGPAFATNIGTFSGITSFTGGAGSNNITYTAGGNTWNITDDNIGNVSGFNFDSFGNLNGGTNDTFILGDGNSVESISTTSGGTIDYSNYTSDVNVTDNGSYSATGIGALTYNIGTFIGGSANSTYTNTIGSLIWTVSGSNTGSVTTTTEGAPHTADFIDFNSLASSGAGSTFVITSGNTIAGNLTGNNATLDISALSASEVNLSTSQASGIGGTFSGISTFIGAGNNSTLTGPTTSSTWNISGPNDGNIGSINFTDFGNLVGGTGNDNFILNGGNLAGSLNGGSGSNTLTVPTGVTNWTIDGANSGSLASITGGFSNIQNLTGGTDTSTFFFTNNGSISGVIDGGNLANINMLDFSGYAQQVDLTLAVPTGSEFNSGTLNLSGTSSSIGSFVQIQAMTGTPGGSSRILLPSGKSNISVTYTNAAQTDGFIGDPFYFFNMLVVTPPAATPEPGFVAPSLEINGNTVIQGTTAYIVNEDNMDITEEGIDSFNNAATQSYGVNVNIAELIQQQNQLTLKLAQETKFGCMQ